MLLGDFRNVWSAKKQRPEDTAPPFLGNETNSNSTRAARRELGWQFPGASCAAGGWLAPISASVLPWSSAIPRPGTWTSSSKTSCYQTRISACRSNKPSTLSAVFWRRSVFNMPPTPSGCPKSWRWARLPGWGAGNWMVKGSHREQESKRLRPLALVVSDLSTPKLWPQLVKIDSGVRFYACSFLTNAQAKFMNHRPRPRPFQKQGN